jgi:hypothetical protein
MRKKLGGVESRAHQRTLSLQDRTETSQMAALGKCDICGAYQYLRVKARKKRIAIQLVHIRKKGGQTVDTKIKVVAVIHKTDLDIHSDNTSVYSPKLQAMFQKLIVYTDKIRAKTDRPFDAIVIRPFGGKNICRQSEQQ